MKKFLPLMLLTLLLGIYTPQFLEEWIGGAAKFLQRVPSD